MADKTQLRLLDAVDYINKYFKDNQPAEVVTKKDSAGNLVTTHKYSYEQMFRLSMDIVGFVAESKMNQGLYVSYHTLRFLTKMCGIKISFNRDNLVDNSTENVKVKGLNTSTTFTCDKLLDTEDTGEVCLSYIQDNKMMGSVEPDSKQIDKSTQRARVKAFAETTGLFHIFWVHPQYVLAKMQEQQNPFYNVALKEQARMEAEQSTNANIIQTAAGSTVKVSKTSTTKKAPANLGITTTPINNVAATAPANQGVAPLPNNLNVLSSSQAPAMDMSSVAAQQVAQATAPTQPMQPTTPPAATQPATTPVVNNIPSNATPIKPAPQLNMGQPSTPPIVNMNTTIASAPKQEVNKANLEAARLELAGLVSTDPNVRERVVNYFTNKGMKPDLQTLTLEEIMMIKGGK